MKILLGFALMVAGASAQQLDVYSEFRHEGSGREIISPAVGRNAFTTFRIVVAVPAGKSYSLHLADNPDKVFEYTVYRESGDRLEKVSFPYNGSMEGKKVETFLLDIWAPADAVVRRVRVEAQLNVESRWIIYPMEIRVMPATVPKLISWKGAAADGPLSLVRQYLCGKAETAVGVATTAAGLIQRNAAQDMLLAKALEVEQGAAVVQNAVLAALGVTDRAAWCASKSIKLENPEQYLHVRDYLLRTALH